MKKKMFIVLEWLANVRAPTAHKVEAASRDGARCEIVGEYTVGVEAYTPAEIEEAFNVVRGFVGAGEYRSDIAERACKLVLGVRQ